MQTQLPVASASFQIPNPSDENTQDSTNLALLLYDLNSDKGKSVYEQPVTQYGADKLKLESYKEWKIYSQNALQGQTEYTILDAKRKKVADVAASIRLAWPHLVGNNKTYDKDMVKVFHKFIDSVNGQIGQYIPANGETIRRPSSK